MSVQKIDCSLKWKGLGNGAKEVEIVSGDSLMKIGRIIRSLLGRVMFLLVNEAKLALDYEIRIVLMSGN
jgi:hypothetical protein